MKMQKIKNKLSKAGLIAIAACGLIAAVGCTQISTRSNLPTSKERGSPTPTTERDDFAGESSTETIETPTSEGQVGETKDKKVAVILGPEAISHLLMRAFSEKN